MEGKTKRYNAINGLRMIAAIGIVLMHVLSNVNYDLPNTNISSFIKQFSCFVFLFMIISAFGMCCGYYKKIVNNEISMNDFYKKRFIKIVPFFAILVIIDVIIERSRGALIEGFADLTLMFSFLQKDIKVIGVAWFLGLVFIFYMIFPFFVFLFHNRKRAIGVTIIAFIMNFVAENYFQVGTTNMFYSFIYFCAGGLLYLYKEDIEKLVNKHKVILLLVTILFTILYFVWGTPYVKTIKTLCMFLLWMIIAIGIENNHVLDNRITAFFSKISMEIYLAHMLVFRLLEKIRMTDMFYNKYLSYCCISFATLIGVIILALAYQFLEKKTIQILNNKKRGRDND